MLTNKTKRAFQNAITERDLQLVGSIVDYLRFNCRFQYDDCYRLAFSLTGISEAVWDELLYEVDAIECGR